MTQRLSLPLAESILQRYSDIPEYDRDGAPSIVHLGTGAFHRAHQAVYFHRLMNAGHKGWMIQGASLRSPRVAQQLNPQDGLFTNIVRDNGQDRYEMIGSIKGVLVGPEDPKALIEAMAQPSVQLVTLTITEKGYKPTALSSGAADPDPDAQHDIQHPDRPRTALGLITAALACRKARGLSGLTVLSCDNLSDNGVKVAEGIAAYARERDRDLLPWIKDHCAFPSSMVDRIVPATTDQDIETLEAVAGVCDPAMVKTEPFSQWVVQDWFSGSRPPLDEVGVQFTDDVLPWEKAKLRLLNGAHSGIAYLGALAGRSYVHEAMSAPGFANFVDRLWDEAAATLDPIKGFDPTQYRRDLTNRFCNSSLQHRTVQIAMDGSQKLPQRLLNTIRDRLDRQQDSPALYLAVAAWMRWQMGKNDAGTAHTVDDPLATETAAAVARGHGQSTQIASELIGLTAIFGTDLPVSERFRGGVTGALSDLMENGSAAAVQRLVSMENCA